MRRRIVVWGTAALVGVGLLAGAQALQAATETSATPESDLSSLISDPRTLDVVACDLESARWGAYDTRIYVEETRDRKARILNLSKGQLSSELVTAKPAWVVWGSPEQQRDGKVAMASSGEAFDKGVPFYISAEFQPPDSVRVTVHSNPTKPIHRSTLFTSWTNAAGKGFMKDSSHLRSTGQPQTFTVKHEDFKDTAAISVWVRQGEMDKANPFGTLPYCLISNEVEVTK